MRIISDILTNLTDLTLTSYANTNALRLHCSKRNGSALTCEDLCHRGLSSNHDNSLDVSACEIQMSRHCTYEVVHAVHLGVGINDRRSALAAVISAHLGKLDVLGIGAVQNTVGIEHAVCTTGLDVEGEDGVIHEVLANRQVNPVSLSGKSDACLLGSLDLLLGTNARVEQKTRGCESAGGEDDSAILGKLDNLLLTIGSLNFNTGGLGARSYNADDLCAEAKSEVLLFLCQREVRLDWPGALRVLDVPGWPAVDFMLLVGLLDHVDRLPANCVEEPRQGVVQASVVSLLVQGWLKGSGVAGVQPVGSWCNVVPLPALGPLIVEVASGRVDKDHEVDSDAASENTSCQSCGVVAHVLVPQVKTTDCRRETRYVDGSERAVPWKSVVRPSCDGWAWAALE
ncbi:hypothetical protein HG530_001651 [Fusarium avenaceum]|nr:hypothetical protein HG530_001651 [Fusarium avenaceum]